MTERLHYDDAFLTQFSARVVERLEWEGRPAVVLDRTAFYATGGGQPHDTGTLDGVAVVEVLEQGADGAVIHVLAAPLPPQAVDLRGEVDRARRLDLMQQHTGQHILSAAFVEALGANTVSFHLSADYASIDLDRAPLSAEELDGVEDLANEVVFQNRPVIARFVADEELPALPLRKPVVHPGPVRIVEIPGFDCSACGGTHVRATGQVGLIKITHGERRGAESRVEFLCGSRALADYRAKNAMLLDLAREFTVGHREVGDLVHRLDEELKEARRELRTARDSLLDAEAAMLLNRGQPAGNALVVQAHLPNHNPDDLKHLAQRLAARPGTLALLGSGQAGQKGSFVFARGTGVELHVGDLMRRACEAIGGRGGGRPEFAQGGGTRGEGVAEALQAAMELANRELSSSQGGR
jgi:alanyl-tRNA synthetase